jgi:hypothetical protein
MHSAVERKAVLGRYFVRKGVDLAYTEERKEVVVFTTGSAFERNFRLVAIGAIGQSQRRGQNMIEATGIRMHDTEYREQDKGYRIQNTRNWIKGYSAQGTG